MNKKKRDTPNSLSSLPSYGFSDLFKEQRKELIRQDPSCERKINKTINLIIQTERGKTLPSALRMDYYTVSGVRVYKVYVDDELRLSFHWENREIVFRKVGHHDQMTEQP